MGGFILSTANISATDAPTIRMSKAHFPVTVLGPGPRIGLWLQGCSIGCHGCSARDTWDPEGGTEFALSTVLDVCRDWIARGATGITISGGEPFDQAQALAELVQALRSLIKETGREIDILCYSGYSLERLLAYHEPVLVQLDAVLIGPYVARRPATRAWRGSDNQQLVVLSELGGLRFGADDAVGGERRLQISVEDGAIWLIGVPAPGDLDRLEVSLAERGLLLGDVSWRS